jgi:DNA polymerase I-like protein with 3'-5' exonuclease and polymerase domains
LPADKKEEVKIKLKKDHPEIAVMWNEYFRLQGELQRAAMNYRIQGLAGSQTKLAAVMFRRYQIENNLRDVIYLVSLIHDEVLAEVKEQYAEQGRKLIELVMVEGANKFCKRVKMGAESHAVEFWHH